jgi:hypothetical protein
MNRDVRDAQALLINASLTLVMRTATQSVPASTTTAITWDTEINDSDGMLVSPSANLIVRRPGLYAIQLAVPFATASGGGFRSAAIAVNTINIAQQVDQPAQSNTAAVVCSVVAALNTNDVITTHVFQDTAGALNIGGVFNGPRMSVRLVSTAQLDVNYANPTPPTSTLPTADNPTFHSNVYQPVWSRTFDGSLATTYDDSVSLWQGYDSNYRGQSRSLVGFNSTTIQSDLAGASNIVAHLFFACINTYNRSGGTAVIGTHNYTAKPSTWAAANVFKDQQRLAGVVQGRTYSVQLTPWAAWALQQGLVAGCAFGPAPSTSGTYYSYYRGATEGGKPYLVITFTK